MRQPELTSLIGLRDGEGDRLQLVRLDPPHGTHGYMLRVGSGKVFLTAGDLARLGAAIRFELVSANQYRFIAQAISLLIFVALLWLLTSGVTGPLFCYPWST